MSDQRMGTVTALTGNGVIADDLDGSTGLAVDYWATSGPGVVGDRVLYDIVAGQLIVFANLTSYGVWTPYTPLLTRADTGATVAQTTASRVARYCLLGKTVFAKGTIVAAASSSGGGAAVDLPFTARDRDLAAGVAGIFTGTPPTQIGMGRMTSDKQRLVALSTYGGAFADIASGQQFVWNLTYEMQ